MRSTPAQQAARRAGAGATAQLQDIEGEALLARLEGVPFTWWHTRARLVMGSATFLDAFDALSLAFVMPALIGLWHMSTVEVGVLIGVGYVGQLFGALLFSRLAENFGRVPGASAATAMMSVMSLGCAIAGNFPALMCCRLVQGIGVGGEMPVAATYISELSLAAGRGRFFMLYEMIFPIGLMATGQIGSLLVPLLGWQVMFLAGGLPGLVVAVLIWRLPESPRWLISRGRLDQAQSIIEEIEASTKDRVAPTDVLDRTSAGTRPPAAPGPAQPGQWEELLSPFYRGRTLIAWSLWASAYFVANGLNNWMPTLYKTVYGLGLQESLSAAALTNVAQVILLVICAFCIDRIGRRNWMIAVFVAGALLLATLGAGASGDVRHVMVLATLAYGAIGSANAVLYLYTPEIYPTRMRAIGTGLATSWLRLASAAGPPIVGLILHRSSISSVFLMFAGVSVFGALAASQMIATERKRLEDVSP